MHLKQTSDLRAIIAGGVFGLSIICGGHAGAVPARVHPHTVNQPDGTTITVTKIGDERSHFTVDANGNLVVPDGEKGYCYGIVNDIGKVVSTGIQAVSTESRAAADPRFNASILIPQAMEIREKSGMIRTSRANRQNAAQWNTTDCTDPNFRMLFTDFPTTGKNKALVILVEFSDVKFTVENPKQYFSDLLNKNGFNENGCIGSARDFFIKSSTGLFEPEFDVYGPVNVGKSVAYYGQNSGYYDQDIRPEEMIVDACKLLDEEIDYTQYNLDGDNKVDNVYVFYAGLGEADNPESTQYANTIWPHAWDLYSKGGITCRLDGLLIDHYACSNELRGVYSTYPKKPVGIGTFVHEFSHVMGLPDLYDVNYAMDNKYTYLYYTPGDWSTLDSGPYNGDGCIPPIYGAFERFSLGWLKPKQFGATKEYTIHPIEESNEAYIVYTDRPAEFFLFENRQKSGFDKELPNHGMLAWHIDFVQNIWNRNQVNASSHQYVDLVEANGLSSHPGSVYDNNYYTKLYTQRMGDPFPGSTNNTRFNATNHPKFVSWSGKATNITLSDISENGNNIIVKVTNADNPTNIDPAGVENISNDAETFDVWTSEGSIFTDAKDARIYDTMGRAYGNASFGMPIKVSPGIYLVVSGKHSRKVMVK